MKSILYRAFGIGVVLLGATLLSAQEREVEMIVGTPGHGGMRQMNVTAMAPQGSTYTFVAAHAGMEGKVVKGKPYSAEGVTETTRVLADGTKIVKKSTNKIYRDSQGRTRREMTMGGVGPLAAEGESVTTVTINDPVNNRMFVTTKGSKVAKRIEMIHSDGDMDMDVHVEHEGSHESESEHKVRVIKKEIRGSGTADAEPMVWVEEKEHSGGLHVIGEHDFSAVGPGKVLLHEEDAKTEDLGERVIEGVVAKGTRSTSVIPEGKIGNDGPITITRESWYSEELEAVVLTKSNDPMTGVVTYMLTNINRAEPDPSLFGMPADMEVESGHTIRRRIRVEEKSVPKEI